MRASWCTHGLRNRVATTLSGQQNKPINYLDGVVFTEVRELPVLENYYKVQERHDRRSCHARELIVALGAPNALAERHFVACFAAEHALNVVEVDHVFTRVK